MKFQYTLIMNILKQIVGFLKMLTRFARNNLLEKHLDNTYDDSVKNYINEPLKLVKNEKTLISDKQIIQALELITYNRLKKVCA